MQIIKSMLAVLASATLVACGGGGGGGSSSPQSSQVPPASAAAPLAAATFGTYAGPTAAAVLASATADNGLEILASASSSSASALQSSSPSRLALWVIGAKRSQREQAQASSAFNEACPSGGSLSGSFDDADGNNDLSAGDTLTINASNCVTEPNGLSISGGFSIRVNSIAFDNLDQVTSASLSMSFTNFTSAGNTLNGAVTVSVSGNAVTTSYENFSNSRSGIATSILNFTSVVSSTGSLSISGLITINNNTYTLSTPVALAFGAQYPINGTVRLTDAAGGRIDFVSTNVSGGYLDCDLYLPGDSLRDGRISSAWSAI